MFVSKIISKSVMTDMFWKLFAFVDMSDVNKSKFRLCWEKVLILDTFHRKIGNYLKNLNILENFRQLFFKSIWFFFPFFENRTLPQALSSVYSDFVLSKASCSQSVSKPRLKSQFSLTYVRFCKKLKKWPQLLKRTWNSASRS